MSMDYNAHDDEPYTGLDFHASHLELGDLVILSVKDKDGQEIGSSNLVLKKAPDTRNADSRVAYAVRVKVLSIPSCIVVDYYWTYLGRCEVWRDGALIWSYVDPWMNESFDMPRGCANIFVESEDK